jgi:DNA primase
MGRVPDEEIERLKREISVERLAEARGVKLVRTGSNLMGLCPFHDDREPSLVITPDKNLWHCLGACQTGGSAIDWVMRAEGASFRHAVELLRGGAELGRSSRETKAVPKHHMRRKLEPLASGDAADRELMSRVVGHYHATLKQSSEALGYLAERGLEHGELVERFQLGFANRTLGYRLPQAQTKLGATLRRRLIEIGVYRASGHEHFSGCLVVPLYDAAGAVVGLYGRRIERARIANAEHLYLPGGHRGLFNREAFAQEELIVTEALLDALTFWSAGYRHVTSAYGVEGVTDELVGAIAEGGVKRVRIAFDRDEAGERGAQKLSARLREVGVETFRVMFPRGMDANEYARKVTPARHSLGLALQQAAWLGRGRPRTATATAATTTTTNEPPSCPPSAAPAEAEMTEVVAAAEIASPAPIALETTTPEAKAEPPAPAAEPLPSLVASRPAGATPKPASAETSPAPPATSVEGERTWRLGEDRAWRVRRVGKTAEGGELRANVFVSSGAGEEPSRFFVDTLDLYAARQRAAFVKHAAAELGIDEAVLGRELGQVLLEVEKTRDEGTGAAAAATAPAATMTDEERAEALALLRDPRLCERIVEDLARAGIVGEETNKLVGYLAATSRKLDAPLAVVIQSSSAAGKSSLMDAVLSLVPEEDRVQYSAMTGQSLFYMNGQDLRHKVLAIVEEEGAERASYALKLLQSEGELTIASTGKDPATGRHVTQTYRVQGPVMIFLTTTAIEVDEELMNRCLVLSVDEGREQTRAIHERQRRAQTLEGQIEAEERRRVRRLYRNAQRLLLPVRVVNPHAKELRFPDHTTRTRRDHMKYLTLIQAVTLLHQHQRPRRSVEHRGQVLEYIEATRKDVEVATRLAHAVLGRSLDELPPQTRRLLGELEAMVRERMRAEGVEAPLVRFTRRELRAWSRWGDTQLKVHLKRLEELEYVLMHRGRGPLVHYELRYGGEGKDGERFVLGLAYEREGDEYDADRSGQKGDRSGQNGDRSGSGRPPVGPRSGGGRGQGSAEIPDKKPANGALHASSAKNAFAGPRLRRAAS